MSCLLDQTHTQTHTHTHTRGQLSLAKKFWIILIALGVSGGFRTERTGCVCKVCNDARTPGRGEKMEERSNDMGGNADLRHKKVTTEGGREVE